MSAVQEPAWAIGAPSPDIRAQATVRDANGWDVAHLFGDSAQGRARLIAAAPELFRALRNLLDCKGGPCTSCRREAAAALSKAQGGGQ